MAAIENSTDRFNGVIASLAIKAPCVAVAITNITLSGAQTVNGVAVVSGDRVLVTAQTSSVNNGIYDVRSTAWARSADFDGNRDVTTNTLLMVARSVGDPVLWRCTSVLPITINTSAITFEKFNGTGGDFDLSAGVQSDLIYFDGSEWIPTVGKLTYVPGTGINLNDPSAGALGIYTESSHANSATYYGVAVTETGQYMEIAAFGSLYAEDNKPHHLYFASNIDAFEIEGALGTFMRFEDIGADMSASINAPLFMLERSAALADVSTYGQFWVRDDANQTPMFTDEAGVEYELNGGSGSINTDINTATPPTTESVVGAFEIYDLADDDILASFGYIGAQDVYLQNFMHGGQVFITAEDAAGVERTILQADPDGSTVLTADINLTLRTQVNQLGVVCIGGGEVRLYDDNALTAGTWPTALGGFRADNDYNGISGLERVQTASEAEMGYASVIYDWNTNTAASDPTQGTIKGDNATISSITNIYVDDLSDLSRNMEWLWGSLLVNDILVFRSRTDEANSAVFQVSGTVVDNTGWWTIPVTYIAGSGSFASNEELIITPNYQSNPGETNVTWSSGNGATWATGSTAAVQSGAVQTFESGAILEIEEAASMADPAAGHGRVWVLNDAPNLLMYTDDAGDDYVVAGNDADVGLTAHVGSSQGDGPIAATYNVYSTVANAGDAATLPATSVVGDKIYIKNDGANSMDVFPASGDDAGAGTDTAVAVANGVGAMFMATVANATWTQMY